MTFGERAISLLGMNEAQIARAGVGRKFQRPTVFEDQTVEDNLILAAEGRAQPVARAVLAAKAADMARVQELGRTRSALATSCTANPAS